MLAWLKSRTPLQGSVWFPGDAPIRPDSVPFLRDPRFQHDGPEWKEDIHWQVAGTHSEWGRLNVIFAADPPPMPAVLAPFHALTDAEFEAVQSARSAIYLAMQGPGENALRERKALLRALATLGGAAMTVAVDHLAQRLWTFDDLADELAHDADLDVEGVFSLHAVADEQGMAADWLHTHGLAELGGFDFHILPPRPGAVFNARTEAVRALAGMILEGKVKADRTGFPLFARAPACFVPAAEFLANADGHASATLKRCVGDDETHRSIAAVLCDHGGGGMIGRMFGRAPRPKVYEALWDDAVPDAAVTAFTEGMTALMAERAAATYAVLRRYVAEFESFRFPVGVKLAYEDDRGGREHLWFRPHVFADESIDATLESPPFNIRRMKLGERGTHETRRLTDWLIGTPVGHITPRSQAVARIIREHADEVGEAMKAGWPQ